MENNSYNLSPLIIHHIMTEHYSCYDTNFNQPTEIYLYILFLSVSVSLYVCVYMCVCVHSGYIYPVHVCGEIHMGIWTHA